MLRDGADGPWATFNIHVGTPPQPLRVMASINTRGLSVVQDDAAHSGCPANASLDCSQRFNLQQSSTWHDATSILVHNESGSAGEAVCGSDAAGIGLPGDAGITLQSQVFCTIGANFSSNNFLGLSPLLQDNLTFDRNVTFLTSLKMSHSIPSLSFGLSVGANYREYF